MKHTAIAVSILLQEILRSLKALKYTLIEQIAAARFDHSRNRLAAQIVGQQVIAAGLFLRFSGVNELEQSPISGEPLLCCR